MKVLEQLYWLSTEFKPKGKWMKNVRNKNRYIAGIHNVFWKITSKSYSSSKSIKPEFTEGVSDWDSFSTSCRRLLLVSLYSCMLWSCNLGMWSQSFIALQRTWFSLAFVDAWVSFFMLSVITSWGSTGCTFSYWICFLPYKKTNLSKSKLNILLYMVSQFSCSIQ